MNEHHPQCPLHEDYELDEQDIKKIEPAEVLDLVRAVDGACPNMGSLAYLAKVNKPFLWMLDCRCAEITEAYMEQAAEDRAEREMDTKGE